jgi:hypothetical protein
MEWKTNSVVASLSLTMTTISRLPRRDCRFFDKKDVILPLDNEEWTCYKERESFFRWFCVFFLNGQSPGNTVALSSIVPFTCGCTSDE